MKLSLSVTAGDAYLLFIDLCILSSRIPSTVSCNLVDGRWSHWWISKHEADHTPYYFYRHMPRPLRIVANKCRLFCAGARCT